MVILSLFMPKNTIFYLAEITVFFQVERKMCRESLVVCLSRTDLLSTLLGQNFSIEVGGTCSNL